MKNVLAFDISTKPGWAFLKVSEDGKVESLQYNTLFPDKSSSDFGDYPFNYVLFADYVVEGMIKIYDLIKINNENLEVVAEETTASQNNYSQKILEFIHYAFIKKMYEVNQQVSYIRTGVWRDAVGAKQTKDERNLNAKIARIKKSTGKKLAKIDGKVVGKKGRKDYSIRAFKEHFGIELKKKMEDAAEAALLGLAYVKGSPICDGTLKGGTARS